METSLVEWLELEDFLEHIITDTKEEETKDVVEELNSYLDQNNTAENDTMTLDVLPSCSTLPDPPSAPEKPLALTFTPQIQNIFSTANLDCQLDLEFIAKNAWNTEYKPETFPALTMRIRKPRSTGRLFGTGSLVCAGTKSVADAHRAARRYARIVEKLGFPVRLRNFQICNIVTTCKFFPVHLNGIFRAYEKQCSFNQEMRSQLVFRGVPGVTANIFHTGQVILNKTKSVEEVHNALDAINQIMSRFRRQ